MTELVAVPVADSAFTWDELIGRSTGFELLRIAYFRHEERLLRESLVVHRGGQPLFLLPMARDGRAAESHPETFACGLLPLLDAATRDDVWPAVQAVAVAMAGWQLTIRTRPSYVDQGFAEAERGAWLTLPAQVARPTAAMALDLTAAPKLSSRRRRGLQRARGNGLSVRLASDELEVRSGWSCIADVYLRRGLPGPMDVSRVLQLIRMPEAVADVHIVEASGDVIGAALGYRLGSAYRLPVYGLLDVPAASGGTESLILAAADRATRSGCTMLDLGTSTDPRTGLTVPGIAGFKYEMGARPRPVEHLVLELPSVTGS